MRHEFGSTPPEQILIMGNHDYWNGLPAGEARKNFARNIGQESPDVHKEIKGFTFIGLSPEDGSLHGTYTAGKSGKFLAPILEKAHREQPGKPVFIVTHHPPRNTVYGADDWGNSDLVELFRNYPEIVNFPAIPTIPSKMNVRSFSRISPQSPHRASLMPNSKAGKRPVRFRLTAETKGGT